MSYKNNSVGMYEWLLREWGTVVGKKRVVKPRFWFLMMATLVLAFMCVYASQGQLMARQAARIAQLEADRLSKMSENALLERKIAFAKTDEYGERVAHQELGLLKKGEIRFVAGSQAGND